MSPKASSLGDLNSCHLAGLCMLSQNSKGSYAYPFFLVSGALEGQSFITCSGDTVTSGDYKTDSRTLGVGIRGHESSWRRAPAFVFLFLAILGSLKVHARLLKTVYFVQSMLWERLGPQWECHTPHSLLEPDLSIF
jgi:hypothetical protein